MKIIFSCYRVAENIASSIYLLNYSLPKYCLLGRNCTRWNKILLEYLLSSYINWSEFRKAAFTNWKLKDFVFTLRKEKVSFLKWIVVDVALCFPSGLRWGIDKQQRFSSGGKYKGTSTEFQATIQNIQRKTRSAILSKQLLVLYLVNTKSSNTDCQTTKQISRAILAKNAVKHDI